MNLLNSIKEAFKDSTYVDITVSESVDTTEYLRSSQANREHLEKSFRELKEGKGIIFTLEEFQEKYGE